MGRIVVDVDNGDRVDVFLAGKLNISRSVSQRMISDGLVVVNGRRVQKSFVLSKGDIIEYSLPDTRELVSEPQPIDIPIVYEDDDIIVVDKPAGMVVHPAPGNAAGTVVNAVLYHVGGLSDIGGRIRPGIVHRLDKDTSGLLIIAKHNEAHVNLAEQFSSRRVEKEYIAAVSGSFSVGEGEVIAPIGRSPHDRKKMAVVESGKYARTTFKVIGKSGSFSLLSVRLHTGRTHQIRVHLSYIKHHVVGDAIYGKSSPKGINRLCLHAYRLVVFHPRSGKQMEFVSCLPMDFVECLAVLGLSLPEWICVSCR